MEDEKMNKKKVDIPPGTVLLQESPFVYVLSSKFRTECCDFCFSKNELLKCSGCKYVHYCDKVCQKDAWSVHKKECKKFKKIAPRTLPDAARMLFRLIKKLENDGDLIKSYYTEKNYRIFKDLMSHYNELKNDKRRLDHLTSLYGVLSEFATDEILPNFAELMTIFGRMCVNSFNICNGEMQSLGTGMYLGASIVDHSCKPNALATFEGTTLYIRNLETLPVLDWSKIFISYIDIMALTIDRQKELEVTYYFLCKCPLCTNPEPIDEMTGVLCPKNGCNNNLNGSKLKTGDVCNKCCTTISKDFLELFKEVSDFTECHIQSMKNTTSDLDVCKVCLKKHESLLYKYNIKHVKILDLAFESSIDLGQFEDALEFGLNLIDGYYKYYGKIHPLTGLLHLKISKLLLFLRNDTGEAAIHLKNAVEILTITHGKRCALYRQEVIPLLQQITS